MVTVEHNTNPQNTKVHLTNSNLNNFKTIEAMGLKIIASRYLQWHHLRTKFYETLPSGSKVISGGHIEDRQTDW
jgi:hypothetical protein